MLLADDGELAELLMSLERDMWRDVTRGDPAWMDTHLTVDFTEFGASGRTYTRAEIIAVQVGPIEAILHDVTVRALGPEVALVTYRSIDERGTVNRSSIWRRVGGEWRLAFHQGTPTD